MIQRVILVFPHQLLCKAFIKAIKRFTELCSRKSRVKLCLGHDAGRLAFNPHEWWVPVELPEGLGDGTGFPPLLFNVVRKSS